MAAENTELNTSLFMQEVQKYPAIYNKFSKDFKKFIRMNIWKAIGQKFGLDAAQAEKKYKNVRTSYGRYLRKNKKITSQETSSAIDVRHFVSEYRAKTQKADPGTSLRWPTRDMLQIKKVAANL